MPARPEGVYQDGRGGWYFKVTVGRDPLTGKRDQITRRGFRSAAEAGRERREVLAKIDRRQLAPSSAGLTVNELLDLYLDGLDADGVLSPKTRYDYRHYARDYVRPYLGDRRVRDVTPEVVLAWQRKLAKEGGTKRKKGRDGQLLPGKPLAPNTIRLARASLAGAFKLATTTGSISSNPMLQAPRLKPRRSIPQHWSPEQAREFLALMEGDRTWPIWAFLLGSGLRIGELVSVRWSSVDLRRRHVRVVDFVSTLGYDLLPSTGKSKDAVRTIELDDGLVGVLRQQKVVQDTERRAATEWAESDLVFTKVSGGQYHPQVPVPPSRDLFQGTRAAAAHRARTPAHQRHPHAGQRRRAQGGGRASRPCRPDALHQPVQPRHSDDATRGRRADRFTALRR